MIELDPIKHFEKIQDSWEDPASLFKLLFLTTIIWFGIPWLVYKQYDFLSTYNIYILFVFLLIIAYWLFTTNRIFIKPSIGIAYFIEDDSKTSAVKPLFKNVVRNIRTRKELKFLYPKLLPASQIKGMNELNSFVDQNSNLQTLIWFDVNTGKENNIDSMLINHTSFCARFHNPVTKNFMADMQIRHATKDWKYIESNSLNDKTKIKNNLFDIILFYNGLFAIYQSRFNEAIQILKILYDPNERLAKTEVDKQDPKKVKISVNAKNIIAGRLAVLLQACFVEAGQVLYGHKDYQGAFTLLRQAETTLVNIPDPYNFYIGLALFAFESGDIHQSKRYTEKMKAIKGQYALEVLLNQGFYAITENNINEFIKNYKSLDPTHLQQNYIHIREFLDRQSQKYPDSRLLFILADGIITKLYIDRSEGNKIIRSVIDELNGASAEELRNLRFFSYKMLRKSSTMIP